MEYGLIGEKLGHSFSKEIHNQIGSYDYILKEIPKTELTAFMQANLALYDAQFDMICFCPHHPDAPIEKYRQVCHCRKPKPGMFLDAQKALDIDLEHSLMIGDHASDLIAASNAGIKECYLVGDHLESEKAKFSPLKLAKNLVQVVENLKNEKK